MQYRKVVGTNNPVDLFSNHLDEKTSRHHIETLGYQAADGRAEGRQDYNQSAYRWTNTSMESITAIGSGYTMYRAVRESGNNRPKSKFVSVMSMQ